MGFLKKFLKRVGEVVGAKILANPLSFLGVTGVFIVTLYLEWKGEGHLNLSMEGFITFGITYITALFIFMNKDASSLQRIHHKTNNRIEIKQNNIGLFNFVKSVKK